MSAQKRDLIRMRHMLDAAVKAVSFVADKNRVDLETDEKLALALVRLVEVVGEAASRVTPDVQTLYSGIAWRDIIGTRNRLIHGYDDVNLDILWQIVSSDLPPLIQLLRHAIDDAASQNDLFSA